MGSAPGLRVGILFALTALGGCQYPADNGKDASTKPGVAYASVSVKCGGDVYTVTTGNNSGKCSSSTGPGGAVESATCDDGQGNGASVSCKNGVGACNNSSGSGGCTIKAD